MEHEDRNPIALALTIAGYVFIIVGFAAGLYLGFELSVPVEAGSISITTPHPLRWVYGVAVIVFSLITGLLFLGFGENLKILHRIANR